MSRVYFPVQAPSRSDCEGRDTSPTRKRGTVAQARRASEGPSHKPEARARVSIPPLAGLTCRVGTLGPEQRDIAPRLWTLGTSCNWNGIERQKAMARREPPDDRVATIWRGGRKRSYNRRGRSPRPQRARAADHYFPDHSFPALFFPDH
jgi:hypothetical protein